MPTKEQLSEEINEMLDTDIDWSQLDKEDLKVFREAVDQGLLIEPMTKHMVKKHGSDKFEKQVDDWYPGKFARSLM